MSLLQELKRRNVFRVGIAYLVVSWLVLQVADVVMGNIGSPPWVFKTLLLVIAIGFPVTLVIAWAFELTPDGLKRDSEVPREESIAPQTGAKLNLVIIIVLVMAVTYFALDKFVLRAPGSQAVADTNPAAPVELDKSIVVLPFSNRSAIEGDAFFVDGIHDDILTHLSKLSTIEKVISRTTAETYRGSALSVGEIAAELGVATVLEGGVQRAGDSIRINMQLIDARTDKHLWAEIYEREMTIENLFDIQSEITREIVAALNGVMSDQDKQQLESWPTQSLEAYEQYTLGRQQMAQRTADSLSRALEHFERAIALDADYALAYVGIADALGLLPFYSSMRLEDTYERRREEIDKALSLNPSLGEAYTSFAALKQDEGDVVTAERYFLRAIELNPNYETARHWYAMLLRDNDRIDEAIVQASKARDIDPAAPILSVNEARILGELGRFDEARAIIFAALKRNPEFAGLYNVQGELYRTNGDFAMALRWIDRAVELAPGDPSPRFFQCDLLADLGKFADSAACADRAGSDLGEGIVAPLMFAYIPAAVATNTLPALIEKLESQVADNDQVYRPLAVVRFLAGDRIGAGEALQRSDPAMFAEDAELRNTDGFIIVAAAYFAAKGDTSRADTLYQASRERVTSALPAERRIRMTNSVLAAAVQGKQAIAVARLREAMEINAPVPSWLMRAPVIAFDAPAREWEAAIAQLEEKRDAMREQYEAARDQPLIL